MFHSSDKHNSLFLLNEKIEEEEEEEKKLWIWVGGEDSKSSVPCFSLLQVKVISKPNVDILMNLKFCLSFLCGQSPVQWREFLSLFRYKKHMHLVAFELSCSGRNPAQASVLEKKKKKKTREETCGYEISSLAVCSPS